MNEPQSTQRHFTGPGKRRAAFAFVRQGCGALAEGSQDVDLVKLEAAYGMIGRPWQKRVEDVAALKKHAAVSQNLKDVTGGSDVHELVRLRDVARQEVTDAKQKRIEAEQRCNNASHLVGVMRTLETNNPALFGDIDSL